MATIIDHTNSTLASLLAIPSAVRTQVRNDLNIYYGHTSHGNQLIAGLTELVNFTPAGSSYAMPTIQNAPAGYQDLNQPDYVTWEATTRAYLNNTSNPWVNVVMWSWCGGVGTATTAQITQYCSLMSGLERDYPNIKFVYMTGHLNGTGSTGALHRNNEQIRQYCRDNNKILYDFADIERYDPDGNDYLDLGAGHGDDGCSYSNGTRNWGTDWQSAHTQGVDW